MQGAHRPNRAYQELWFALARREWRSAVLVPADAESSAAAAASELANVGRQVHSSPVTLFIVANPSDCWPAVQIVTRAAGTNLSPRGQRTLAREPLDRAVDGSQRLDVDKKEGVWAPIETDIPLDDREVGDSAPVGGSGFLVSPSHSTDAHLSNAALMVRSVAQTGSDKVIVAVQPVVAEPLGLSVTQAADIIVLCVEKGRTRLASARRTIELIGRERIAGCLLIADGGSPPS